MCALIEQFPHLLKIKKLQLHVITFSYPITQYTISPEKLDLTKWKILTNISTKLIYPLYIL